MTRCRLLLHILDAHLSPVAHLLAGSSPSPPPQVSSLQEQLHSASLDHQSCTQQNLQLQLSLQQQQNMLTDSTAHISELEESQSQLQAQVSR